MLRWLYGNTDSDEPVLPVEEMLVYTVKIALAILFIPEHKIT
jgi:hypothetical protein